MTPVDRMIRTRQQQRDEAARELAAARERLRELEEERAALTERCRAELEGAVGTETLSLAALETMDASRRWAEVATERSEVAVDEAQRVTAELHRLLRQLEILRERAAERGRAEESRRERRMLDELAARRSRGRLLCLAPLALALLDGSLGCKGKEEKPAADAAVVDASDAGDLWAPSQPSSRPAASQPSSRPASQPASRPASDAGAKRDAMTFSLSELHQLSALRARALELAKKERELAARERRLATSTAESTPSAAKKAATTSASQPVAPKEAETQALVDLLQVLERMAVRPAAAMLAEMDPGLVASALRKLPAKKVASILAQMPPDKAGPVASRLAKRAKEGDGEPAATSAGEAPGKKPASKKPADPGPSPKAKQAKEGSDDSAQPSAPGTT